MSQSATEAEIRRARELMKKGRFADALQSATVLLAEVPENRDVLYLIATSQRYLGNIAEALATLDRLEELHPSFGRLFQERGHCHAAIRSSAAALDAYRNAVTLNPALIASWRARAELSRAAGHVEESELATLQIAHLEGLPPAVLTGSDMLAEGNVLDAERLLRSFLQRHERHVEAMRLLARIGYQLDVLDDAEFLLESAVLFAPDNHVVRYDYAVVLSKRHKHRLALEQARRLLEIDANNRAYRTLYATTCVGLGDHSEALRVYRSLVDETPDNPELHLSIAHTLKTLGRQQEAIDAYHAAAEARSDYGDAYWSLANLKTYRFTDAEIDAMQRYEAAPATRLVDRYHLCFALGKALEDRARYADSFRYYERGNVAKRGESRFDVGEIERNLKLQASLCTAEFFVSRAGGGSSAADPIFIVGLPRSGSTLLEQILASHSQIEGTMELPDIPRLVQELSGREHHGTQSCYPGVLATLTPAERLRLGEKYLADTRVHRTGKPFFIDKMPNNFRHIGLIHLILPNARIIDARREPMACCFSNFKQLFASGQEFTYSLDDIARYYRAYVEVMEHWDRALPGKIFRVQHEELVEDLEASVRAMLDFLNLEFESPCLRFYQSGRSVRTASSEQVRRPISTEGLNQWRHFAPWLDPLKHGLRDLVLAR